MNIVEQYIWNIIKREGGYVNHPADKGGPTKYGITLPTLHRYLKISNPDINYPSVTDIENLTKETAYAIYYILFVESPNFDVLPSSVLQEQVIDAGVNHGASKATKMLQEAINSFGYNVKVDGIIGPQTLSTLNLLVPVIDKVVLKFLSNRAKFYGNILRTDKTQLVFAAGWFNRLGEMLSNYADRL